MKLIQFGLIQAYETLKGLAFKETGFLAKKKVIFLSRNYLCEFHFSSAGVTEQINNLSFSFFFFFHSRC